MLYVTEVNNELLLETLINKNDAESLHRLYFWRVIVSQQIINEPIGKKTHAWSETFTRLLSALNKSKTTFPSSLTHTKGSGCKEGLNIFEIREE